MAQGSVLWYYVFPLIITIIAVFGRQRKKTGLYLFFILLFFSMFRGDKVGNDTMNYMDMGKIETRASYLIEGYSLTSMDVADYGKQVEVLSSLLNYFVIATKSSPRIIIFVYSIISLLFLYLTLKRLQINTAVGLMFYVLLSLYFFSLTAARQMAAVSIFCYGTSFLFTEGSKRKYLFFVFLILATLFHASSIFYFWVFFIPFIRINRYYALALIIGVCTFTCFSSFDIARDIYSTFNMEYILRYEGLYDVNSRSLFGRVFDFLVYVLFFYSFYYRGFGNTDKRTDLYDNLFVLAIIMMALFSHVSVLISRVTFYLVIFISLYMANLSKEKNCFNNLEFSAIFLLYLFLVEYDFGGWAESLQSGYYLMF